MNPFFYKEVLPCPILASYIKYFWILEYHYPVAAPFTFRTLSDGFPGMIFSYGTPFLELKNNLWAQAENCFLYGVLQHYKDFYVSGSFGILGVAFFPSSFHAFLSSSAKELTNNSIDLGDYFGAPGYHLKEKLLNASGNQERISRISDFFISLLQKSSRESGLIKAGVRLILNNQGEITIEALSRKLGISKRHFERKFKTEVGVNPKYFSRLTRFQQVLRTPMNGSVKNLTELAFYCGYSDQAHFIREFKEFSGFSPKKFFSETTEVAENFVSI